MAHSMAGHGMAWQGYTELPTRRHRQSKFYTKDLCDFLSFFLFLAPTMNERWRGSNNCLWSRYGKAKVGILAGWDLNTESPIQYFLRVAQYGEFPNA